MPKKNGLRQSVYDSVRDAVRKTAQRAGEEATLVPRSEHGHTRLRHRALVINGKLVLIHHLTNCFQKGKRGVAYARTSIRRDILKKSAETVVHLAVPGFPERTIYFRSRELLRQIFGDNTRAEKTLYLPL